MLLLPEPQVVVYTDGAVKNPKEMGKGAAGYVIIDAEGRRHTGAKPVGPRCTPYDTELHALRMASQRLREQALVAREDRVHFYSDSSSAVTAQKMGSSGTLVTQVAAELHALSMEHNGFWRNCGAGRARYSEVFCMG